MFLAMSLKGGWALEEQQLFSLEEQQLLEAAPSGFHSFASHEVTWRGRPEETLEQNCCGSKANLKKGTLPGLRASLCTVERDENSDPRELAFFQTLSCEGLQAKH